MNNVLFRRGNQTFIDKNVPLNDGQIIFNETDEAIYVDTLLNGSVVRKRYGGGNLSRSDIDSALSDTSKNPVQNKVITESVLQKTDIVNDYNTAVAVTATDIPVGCGVIKTANTKIGDLQTALNTTNRTVAQHTTDIFALNTGLTNLKAFQTAQRITNPSWVSEAEIWYEKNSNLAHVWGDFNTANATSFSTWDEEIITGLPKAKKWHYMFINCMTDGSIVRVNITNHGAISYSYYNFSANSEYIFDMWYTYTD
jgi:hypothetical protein